MTEEEQAARLAALRSRRVEPESKSGRPGKNHAAAGARWLVAGVAAAASIGMIGAMSASRLSAASNTVPEPVTVYVTAEAGEPIPTTEATTAPAMPAVVAVGADTQADAQSGGS